MEYNELTEKIIGCAFRVYNTLGFGFLESVYEKSLIVELAEIGQKIESQKKIQVFYNGRNVGDFIADLIINDVVIIELKSVQELILVHEVQLVNYLKATNKPVGLLINFGPKRVEVKRKVKDL
jgi:GxxExxY protein